ncbi:hypothetical protein VZT92_007245 [Zoarces viviparus]|uniref:Uncharacterized protein n=1 Tax=Zoarces viviparus TaxID=48416 RepID=A0AAW1FJ02_ZOAVI
MFVGGRIIDFESLADVILSLPRSVSPGSAAAPHPWSVLLKDTSARWLSQGSRKQKGGGSNQHVNGGGLGSRFLWGASTQQASRSNSPPVEVQTELSAYRTPRIHACIGEV